MNEYITNTLKSLKENESNKAKPKMVKIIQMPDKYLDFYNNLSDKYKDILKPLDMKYEELFKTPSTILTARIASSLPGIT